MIKKKKELLSPYYLFTTTYIYWQSLLHFYIDKHTFASESDIKQLYEALVKGDPKMRSYRAIYQNIYTRYIKEAKTELGTGEVRGE